MTATTIRRRAVGMLVALFSLLWLGACHGRPELTLDMVWSLPGGQASSSTTLPHATKGSPYEVRFGLIDSDPKLPNCIGPGFKESPEFSTAGIGLDARFTHISKFDVLMSATPTKAGDFNISGFVKESDVNGISCRLSLKTFSLTVDALGPIHMETGSQLPDGAVGGAYDTTIRASGGEIPYQWAVTAGDLLGGTGLPGTPCEGLSTSASDDQFDVRGGPLVNEGDCKFTLQVTDVIAGTGSDSREFTLHVNPAGSGNPAPTISALAPANAKAGDPAFTLTVTGADFVSGSEVHWNGTIRDTTFVSATELTAAIAAADIADPGTAQVTVFNPAPGGGTSAAKAFAISAPAGVLERVSVSTASEEGDASSGRTSGDARPIAVSEDGRFVVFVSAASNLAPGADNGGNNVTDIFVRDTCRGASAPGDCFKATSRITGPAAPEPGNDYVDITADGQWITFASGGSDAGVWAAPRSGGPAVRLTSTDAAVLFSSFINPAISDSGRFAAVETSAMLVTEDTNAASDVYLFDRDADGNGTFDEAPATVTLISATPTGAAGNGISWDADISADGRYVVFASNAPDLIPGSGSIFQVYLRDTCIGVGGCTAATTLVSAGPSAPGDAQSRHPRITPDARYVAFDSGASNLLAPGGDTNAFSDIYVHDTCIGGPDPCLPANIRVTRAFNGGETNESSARPSISSDGRFVAFESQADNLVSPFTGTLFVHVFATDTCIGAGGCTTKTNHLSRTVDGISASSGSFSAVISPDGRFVDFESGASNLVTGDTNGVADIFLAGSGLP